MNCAPWWDSNRTVTRSMNYIYIQLMMHSSYNSTTTIKVLPGTDIMRGKYLPCLEKPEKLSCLCTKRFKKQNKGFRRQYQNGNRNSFWVVMYHKNTSTPVLCNDMNTAPPSPLMTNLRIFHDYLQPESINI
uniref:Uncharacterized protein n=1 Tax=Parascaris univalens TaxID=6257 RepID=A0A915A3P0_PARUN